MPGFADLFYMGQPNPSQQLAQALQGGQQPGGSMQPGQQGGPAPDPNSPPSPGNPPPGSAQQPMAYQSTPDMVSSFGQLASPQGNNLMSLYLQMDARQRASDQMNRGLAIIAANHSSPAMARAIMESAGAGGGNAGQTFSNLMSIYQTQQQMAGQQAMLQNADAFDQKNNWPSGTARAMIMAGRGDEVVQDLRPTDMQRNYQWARDTYSKNHPGASPEEIDAGAQSILLGAGGGGGAGSEIGGMNIARANWLADPANKGNPPPGYMTDLGKWRLYQADKNDARTQFGGVNDSLNTLVGQMSEIANDPTLDSMQGHPIAQGIRATFDPTSPEGQLYKKMTGAGNTAKDMASRGGPKGVNQNLKTLGSNPDDFSDLGYNDYRDSVIAPRMRQALQAQANARGAAGMANAPDTPGYLQLYMNPMYQRGGELDIGGKPKMLTPDTDANGKPLKQPTAAVITAFKNDMEHYGPEAALKNLQAHGFDTSGLR